MITVPQEEDGAVEFRILEQMFIVRHLMMQNLDKLKGSCREYTLLGSATSSEVKGWIRGNAKIGPVLDVAVSFHQGRCGVEIMINSPIGDGTRSWVRIVNGIKKYVTEMSEETHIEDIGKSTEKPVAKARPKHTPSSVLSSTTVQCRIMSGNGYTQTQEDSTKVFEKYRN